MLGMAARIVAVTIALFAAQMIAGGATSLTFGADALPAGRPGMMPWQVLSNLIVVATLALLASRARWRGWRLAASLALVFYGISSFTSIIEALFFGFFPLRTAIAILAMTLLAAVLFMPALLLLSPRNAPTPGRSSWSLRVTPLRVVAGAAIYTVIYFAFGLAVLPFIASFYEGLGTPNPLSVVAMQFLLRGPMFVGLVALILAMNGGGRMQAVGTAAAAMCLLGGVAPLIVPNALFPDPVRWAHFVEVTTENFLYGWILGLLLSTRVRPVAEAALPRPASEVAG